MAKPAIVIQRDEARRREPFVIVSESVVRDRTLSPSALRLYLNFLLYSFGGRKSAFPSQGLLAADLGMTARQVLRLLEELGRAGLVRRINPQRGEPQVYLVAGGVSP